MILIFRNRISRAKCYGPFFLKVTPSGHDIIVRSTNRNTESLKMQDCGQVENLLLRQRCLSIVGQFPHTGQNVLYSFNGKRKPEAYGYN